MTATAPSAAAWAGRPQFPFMRASLPAPDRWIGHLAPAYEAGWFTNFGPVASRLEQALAARYGHGREGVLVANGTAGLTAALLAVEARGPVVLPSFTFAATAQAVVLAGCTPVFCDVSPDTWELDPEALRRLLGAVRPTAVVHVRAFGLCRPLEEIERVAAEAGIPVVVDAAAGLAGRTADGRAVGGAGEVEVFSLHATKVFGVGEGGFVLAPPELAARMRSIVNFGLTDGSVRSVGLNGKLSEVTAAVGLAVLDGIDGVLAARAQMAASYTDLLADHSGAHGPAEPGRPPWQAYPVLLPSGAATEAFLDTLRELGVEARRYYRPALHRCPVFGSLARLPVTDALVERMVCLPVYGDATGAELEELRTLVGTALSSVGA